MAKYDYTHRKVRVQLQHAIDAGQGLCAEPVCLMDSREIPPGSGPDDWHVCHDPSGMSRPRQGAALRGAYQ